MPNTFNTYTAQEVGEVALSLAKTGFRLADLVTKYGEESFKAGYGRSVYLSVPGALTAHARTLDDTSRAIIFDELSESQEAVSLDTHAYSAVKLGDGELTLDLLDFSKQVLRPQVDAVVAVIEDRIARVLDAITPQTGSTYNAAAPVSLFTAGRAALRDRGVDPTRSDLVAVVGSKVADDLLDSGSLDYSHTGTDTALRKGSFGRIRGFEVSESGSVGESEVIFMTRDALYLAHRPPIVPPGISFGERVSKDGFALRYMRDYDPVYTTDRSVVGTFIGAGIMPLYRVERTQDSGKQGDAGYAPGSASVVEVPGGSVVKFDTAA